MTPPRRTLIAEGVGDRLREERERMELSQAELGALVGVSRGTQQKYELSGASSIDLKYLMSLEQVAVDVIYVLTASRELDEGMSREEVSVLDRYRAIPAPDQRALRLFLKAMFEADGH